MKELRLWLNQPAFTTLAIVIISLVPLLRMLPQAAIHYERTQQEQAR